MGTWGSDSFANDDALDWLEAFTDAPGLEMLRDTLDAILAEDDYLEAPDCCEAIVAAEIIAGLSGHASSHMPDDLRAWLASECKLDVKALRPLAKMAIERIHSSSELQELWDDSDGKAAWHADMTGLLSRLQ